MDLSRVILGQAVTEKSERLKGSRKYTLIVSKNATKIDVKAAIKRYYDIEAQSVRVINTVPKTRDFNRGTMEKRHSLKKVIVTLAPKSKPLDIASFKT